MAFFASFAIGTVVGIVLMLAGRAGRKTQTPFGPFMASGLSSPAWSWRV